MWLICVAGCGRIGFDAGAPVDGAPLVDDPLISVDPRTLPPFGTPQLLALSDPSFDDDDPCLTRDQLEIFFDSNRDGNNDLFSARRSAITEPWSTPVPITAVNSAAIEEHPQISGDGLTLYFTSRRGGGEANLWQSTRPDRDQGFGPPIEIANVNSPELEAMGAVDARDLVLVFSSMRGGLNVDELYESRRVSTDQPWSAPVAIGALNTATFERGPHLDDLGLVIYFDQGGDSRLVWAMRDSLDAPWSAPIALDELDVTGQTETDAWLSPDQRTLYYTVDPDPGGPADKDIYTATR